MSSPSVSSPPVVWPVVVLSDHESLTWFLRKCRLSLVLGTEVPTRSSFRLSGRLLLARFGRSVDLAVARIADLRHIAPTARTNNALYLFQDGRPLYVENHQDTADVFIAAFELAEVFSDAPNVKRTLANAFERRVRPLLDPIALAVAEMDAAKQRRSVRNQPPPPDPREVLGVGREASIEDIKKAHRSITERCHPDKFAKATPNVVRAAELDAKGANAAYEILKRELGGQ